MNILLIAPQPFFSERGTPIAVRLLIETLCADGHRVDLLTYPLGEDLSVDGLTIHRAARVPGIRRIGIGFSLKKVLLDVSLAIKLLRIGRPGRYDVVHAVEESIYLALLFRRRHKASIIYDMDSRIAEQLAESHIAFRAFQSPLAYMERWAIKRADMVVPMCQDLANRASEVRGMENVVVLHDVPVPAADGDEPAEDLSELEPTGRCLALYVGNLEAYQGIDLLVDAVSMLPADCPVRVVVVGGPMSEVERYRSIAAQRGLGQRIEFLGPRPLAQLNSLLAQADILLSPRIHGTNTPLKLYSYMDSGRPILATRLKTHTQVLDESTALLTSPEPGDFAAGLRALVEDEDLRRRLGGSAKQRVATDYSLAAFREKVSSIYTRLQQRATHA